MISEVTGEIEKEEKVLIIKRIHVRYHLKLQHEQRETAERAHAMHAAHCPVARSIGGCIQITTELLMEDA